MHLVRIAGNLAENSNWPRPEIKSRASPLLSTSRLIGCALEFYTRRQL